MRRARIAAFWAIAMAVVLFSAQPSLYDTCIDKATTQHTMNMCARDEFLRADKVLRDLYQELLLAARRDPRSVDRVKRAERAWTVYREAFIDGIFFLEDKQAAYGSVFPMETDLLRSKLTRQQTDIMSKLLRDYKDSLK